MFCYYVPKLPLLTLSQKAEMDYIVYDIPSYSTQLGAPSWHWIRMLGLVYWITEWIPSAPSPKMARTLGLQGLLALDAYLCSKTEVLKLSLCATPFHLGSFHMLLGG